MQFFQRFPALSYTTTEGTSDQIINRQVSNLTVKLVMDILDDEKLPYLNYRIKDTDRPDTVAADVYGTSRYAWIVLLANKMRDWYDWPLTDQEFYTYMNQKYASVEGANDGADVARSMIYQYVWNHPNVGPVVVDQEAYTILPAAQREVISYYRKEYQDNDAKRLIRLPEQSVASDINARLSQLLGT